MNVLDKGECTLVDFMGGDLAVVQAARISQGAIMPEYREGKDEKLIQFLADHKHYTPFEHATFKFYIKAPIFVVREWHRHRTFSYNEISGRYKVLAEEFYVPTGFRAPSAENRQSSYEVTDYPEWQRLHLGEYQLFCKNAFWQYRHMLASGVAREHARMVLPLSTYTEFYATGNFRNWMHFIELRDNENAQWEIRQYAKSILAQLAEKMPVSVAAFQKEITSE